MATILESEVTKLLTTYLGRVPTAAEIANGIKSPWSLANVHNSLAVGQSILALDPTQNIQDAIDATAAQGGGSVFLKAGTFSVDYNILVPSNIHLIGVSSGASIIDFGGGAFQIQSVGTALDPVESAFLQGFTVQNTTVDGISVDYSNNFGGFDVASNNCLSGFLINHSTIFNWSVGNVDTCGSGMIMKNVSGSTVANTFVSNITAGFAYDCDTVSNSVITDSACDTCNGGGYRLVNCTDFGVDEVSVLNITGNGFECTNGGGDSFEISNGVAGNCTGDGVVISGTATQFQFIGMVFSNNGGYGANITGAGCTDNQFVANIFKNNSSGSFHDSGTTTLIRSNIGVADSP